jgi:hypothetical protein
MQDICSYLVVLAGLGIGAVNSGVFDKAPPAEEQPTC